MYPVHYHINLQSVCPDVLETFDGVPAISVLYISIGAAAASQAIST